MENLQSQEVSFYKNKKSMCQNLDSALQQLKNQSSRQTDCDFLYKGRVGFGRKEENNCKT